MSAAISRSRFIAAIAVLCVFIAASVLAIYGAIDTFVIVSDLISGGKTGDKISKQLILDAIELVDLFLLSTVFYVVAIGLYELFIDDNLPVPHWMSIRNLDDLKNKLIAVVIVVLGVTFLGQVVSGTAPQDLFWTGAGIALVIVALTFFLQQKTVEKKLVEKNGKESGDGQTIDELP